MEAEDHDWPQPGSSLAIGCCVGLFWPLALGAGALIGLSMFVFAAVRSFARLWHAIRPAPPARTPEIPRATARER